jgi:hypothetical protein
MTKSAWMMMMVVGLVGLTAVTGCAGEASEDEGPVADDVETTAAEASDSTEPKCLVNKAGSWSSCDPPPPPPPPPPPQPCTWWCNGGIF